MRYSVILAMGLGLAAGVAKADVPQVVTDIPPVHALVARVMDGVGSPRLLIEGTASPHDFALTPAQAGALADADLVIWMGAALAPGLQRSITALSETAEIVDLMQVDGTVTHAFREDAGAGHDGHGHGEHDHDHASHDHAEHGHDEHAQDVHDHDEHAHDQHAHDDHGHDHSGLDPHGWLDPANAVVWTQAIASALSDADPSNAAAYQANADLAVSELDALIVEVQATLAQADPLPFVVFHDAYQYFETRFGLMPVGAISVSSAEAPSAAQVALIRDRLEALGEVCVFAEPQFDPRIVAVVTEGTPARTTVIDPLGAELAPGPALYPELIRAMAARFATCE